MHLVRGLSVCVEMTKDEQARARLVEIALNTATAWDTRQPASRIEIRRSAGFRNPSKGSWCAAGLTAAMEDAGLVVPAPGTPERRGAVALLDWTIEHGDGERGRFSTSYAQPGDIIAWLQHPIGKDPAGWRRGHIALIVAVDDESITTVGWNEGNAPGRVMKRRLWRDPQRPFMTCRGKGQVERRDDGMIRDCACDTCKGTSKVPRSSTVLYRRPGGLYGIARPVAR